MSFAIDLATHGQELKKAYNQVLSSDPETKWAIFGYSNNSLEVQETGASIKEFCHEFDDTQAQYGVCQVDFNGINKIVLVGWVGEGTPQSKRTAFNAHFASVARYFPGYHVQLTAAEDDELTPDVIASKVASGAGANYTAQARKPKYFQSSTGASEDDWGDAKPLEVKEKPELSKVPTAYSKAKIEVNTQKTKIGGLDDDRKKDDGPKKPIDLKALRDSDKDNKFASTKVDKPEPFYKPVGKVDLKQIHENERKQAEAQGKEVEQFSSLKDRMNAFKIGVESAKPQFDTQRSVSGPKKSVVPSASKAQETSPWAAKSASKPSTAESAGSKWTKPSNVHAAASSAPQESDEDDEPETSTSVRDAKARFLNAGKDEDSTSSAPAPAPKKANNENSFASLTSRFAKTSDSPKERSASPPPALPPKKESAPPVKAAALPKDESPEEEEDSGVIVVTCITAYEAEDPEDEITLEVGGVVTEIQKMDDFWWFGTNSKGEKGLFPKENVKEGPAPKSKGPSASSKAPAAPAARSSPSPAPLPPRRKEESPAPPTPARDHAPSLPKRKESPPPPTPARNLPPPPAKRESPAPPTPARKSEPAAPPTPARKSGADIEPQDDVVYAIEAYTADPDADDEISISVGEKITSVEKLDENWWAGTNSKGEYGLFPVENVAPTPNGASPGGAPVKASTVGQAAGVSAVATSNYDADEDDELGFKKGDRIVNIEFPSADWWSGELNGKVGLFPPDFVELE